MTSTHYGPGDEILIVISFDLDPDHYDSSTNSDYRTAKPSWRGIEEGVPALVDLLDQVKDSTERSLRATWFVRADDQIDSFYGSSSAMFERHNRLLQSLVARGDEIAWHPHLSQLDNGAWIQQTNEERLCPQLQRTHAEICGKTWQPLSIRIGGNFCTNGILVTLEELGLAFDSTAMPGRKRQDKERTFDWEITSQHPYYPAFSDYRVPGDPCVNLLEIPLSMVPVKATYDSHPFLRYVDLSFHPEALKESLINYIQHGNLLVTVTHPACVLNDIVQHKHGLLSYDLDVFRKNLDVVVQTCISQDRPFRFMTLAEAGQKLVKQGIRKNDAGANI